ncbi:hypothetical protein [Fructilactobacillus florum]|uniref:hypothetical protein n=1 Tax=Fructilactobacillus florum TaxID=640331 RepID=UPI0006D109FF|nr:hypothetical protein [Fructilactobacillus florum]
MQRLYWDAINIDSHKVFYTVNEQGLNFVSSPECGLSQVLNFYAQSFEYVHDHEVTDAYRKSFKRYLKGKTGEFVVDRDSFVNGTPQEEEVWQRIAAIPYGKTQSVAVLAAEAKVSQQVVLQLFKLRQFG